MKNEVILLGLAAVAGYIYIKKQQDEQQQIIGGGGMAGGNGGGAVLPLQAPLEDTNSASALPPASYPISQENAPVVASKKAATAYLEFASNNVPIANPQGSIMGFLSPEGVTYDIRGQATKYGESGALAVLNSGGFVVGAEDPRTLTSYPVKTPVSLASFLKAPQMASAPSSPSQRADWSAASLPASSKKAATVASAPISAPSGSVAYSSSAGSSGSAASIVSGGGAHDVLYTPAPKKQAELLYTPAYFTPAPRQILYTPAYYTPARGY
jgi:hypothetical protein